MIIARVDGGLGNQMFQYAFGSWLAEKKQTELLLDLGSYQDQPQHGYLLNRFCIRASTVDQQSLHKIPARYRVSEKPIQARQRLAELVWRRPLKRLKQAPFGFDTKYLETPADRYLVGYWQSERFFPGSRSRLLQDFQLKSRLSPASESVAQHMLNCNSLAVHVRRGDYITNQANKSIYEAMTLSYYDRAIKEFCKRRGDAELFVFSNDVEWCKRNLRSQLRTHYVDHNTVNTAHEDLILMSRARGCIIANSTFSWWAGWLNQHDDGLVLAPDRWFCRGVMDDKDLIPSSWIKIAIDEKVSNCKTSKAA